jgi:photosystem II stability/assembly factor-like uncharacterized protein
MKTKKLIFTTAILFMVTSSIAQTNWTTILTSANYSGLDIDILEDSIIYTVGSNFSNPNFCEGFTSFDAGDVWESMSFDTYVGDGAYVYFSHVDTGYVLGFFGNAVKTVNGGQNWTDISPNLGGNIYGVLFINSQVGFIGGWGGEILRTTNGGSSWLPQNSGITTGIHAFHFQSDLVGYACGENGVLLKTIDGGTNWSSLNTGVTTALRDLDFPTADTGYIIGSEGIILKSVTGGLNWTPQISNTLQSLHCVEMISVSYGYVTGSGSTFLETTDGGQNWNSIDLGIGSSVAIQDVIATSDTTIYVCAGEHVLKSDHTTATADLDNRGETQLSVYPNPATNQITISIESMLVGTLQIFDQLGKLILAEDLLSNSHNVSLKYFSTGIYYVIVTSGDKTWKQKVLLK